MNLVRSRTGRLRIQASIRALLDAHRIVTPLSVRTWTNQEIVLPQATRALYMLNFIGAVVCVGGKGRGRCYMSAQRWNKENPIDFNHDRMKNV